MSISATLGAVVDAGAYPGLTGAVALELVSLPGGDFLYVAGESDPSILQFDLATGLSHVETRAATPGAGASGLTDLVSLDGGQGPALVTLGRYDSGPGDYALGSDGTMAAVVSLGDGSAPYQRALTGISYAVGGVSYLALSHFGQPDLHVLRIDAGPTAALVQTLADDATRALGNVAALATATLHGDSFLFAGGGVDAGITAGRIGAGGLVTITDTHLPEEASGFAHVSALDAVQIGPRAFLVLAATGTDSLHVLRVSAGGRLKEVDVFYDTRDTRVADAQALEVFTASGRVFVAVAGGDDGVSIFELDWRGQLSHLLTIEDLFTSTLANVSDLAVLVDGDSARLFASSPRDHGVTELLLDTGLSGVEIRGGPVAETLTGTSGDDHIWGMGKSDILLGLDGDDRLVDGRGRDTLTGGPGADTFVFIPDGRSDFITDYEPGIDLIDLSAWDGLYHVSGIEIGARANGAVIFVGEDIIRVSTSAGGPIDTALFTQDDFVFG